MSTWIRSELRNYQRRAIRFGQKLKQAAFFIEIGLGKTITLETILLNLLKDEQLNNVPALIIAPARVVRFQVWQDEAKEWMHTRNLTFCPLVGSAKKRRMLLKTEKPSAFIVSADNTRWLCKMIKNWKVFPFSLLIIDESTKFKDSGTKRWRALSGVAYLFDRRYVLTGTPRPDSMLQIWAQMYLVDLGARLGESYTRFKERYFEKKDYYGYRYEIRPGAARKITHLIEDVTLSLRAKDWLDLPPLIPNTIKVALPPAAARMYADLEKTMFLEMELVYVEAISAAVLSNKCHQLANGFIYGTDTAGNRVTKHVHDAKIEAVQSIVEQSESPVLVTYQYKEDLRMLRKAFPKAPMLTEDVQDAWNARKHHVAFIYPGHGLNLQAGGHTLVFYGLPWSGEQHDQIIGRIGPTRQVGRAPHVLVHYLITANTVDEAIMLAQERKARGQRALLSALNDYRRGTRYVHTQRTR